MAHVHGLVSPENFKENGSYVDGLKTEGQVEYPKTSAFAGFNKPCRLEGDIFDLEFEGTIPKEIDGTFYRVQPDPRFPPVFEDDVHFSGDGSVTAIRIQNGHADFKQRYVQTDRFQHETAARKSLFGKYRNFYTDNEAVKGVIRTVANTNIFFWRGTLLAIKEDGPPYAMDPVTLETIGRYDFEGQVLSPTFTAHPKFDPDTGEMVCYGYEAGGNGQDGSNDIVVYTIDANGKKTEEAWYKAPFCGMIHDCGLTKNYLVLPMTPLKCSHERLKKGGNHWAWDPNEDQLYGIVPRRNGKPEDIVWLRADNAFHGHTAGCYENDDGHIVYDLTLANGNVFVWWPPEKEETGTHGERNQLQSPTVRWVFDPKLPTDSRVKPAQTINFSGEFSRIDDRLVTKNYNHIWQCGVDPTRFYDAEKGGPPVGGLFNVLRHVTWDGKIDDVYWQGTTSTFQEPAFIPKHDGGEGEGWLISLINHHDTMLNDIVILDAMNLAAGPVAVIHLPFKLRLGVHGNFVDHNDIKEWEARRGKEGDVGPLVPAQEPLPWQKAQSAQEAGENNATGANADTENRPNGTENGTNADAPVQNGTGNETNGTKLEQ